MRRDNPFRQPAIERLIERSADGLLHTIKCEDEMPKRKKRKECSEQSMEEIDIEYDQYTRPPEFRGMKVPEVLLSGHAANIAKYQKQQSTAR